MRGSYLAVAVYIAVLLCLPDVAYSKEYATFESFYQSSTNDLLIWGTGAILAITAGLTIFFTGGTASPIVVWIGTQLGTFLGLSGAAATNAGLALLGGGAVAAGGLGIAGGVAVLTSALTFSADLITSYTIEDIFNKRDYTKLALEAKDLPNFPAFINDDGPDEIKDAARILKKYDSTILPSSPENIKVIKAALAVLESYVEPNERFWDFNFKEKVENEKLRVNAAKAILYFMENNLEKAIAASFDSDSSSEKKNQSPIL